MAITTTESKTLMNSAATLRALADTLEKAAGADIDDVNAGLDTLVPTGNLDTMVEEISSDSVISEEELNDLIAMSKHDIAVNSRLNGLLKNITIVIESVRKTVLPIVGKMI